MKKVFLAGATGHLGQHVLQELKQQSYHVTALVRSEQKLTTLSTAPDHHILADATKQSSLNGCCKGMDVVISALGKSISLWDSSKATFHDIDYGANFNLLQEAKAAGVKQFIYVSAFAAEKHPKLAYFKAHADFTEALIQSGINYQILQPTALFSAFHEVLAMAKRGRIGVIGAGDKLTNPVFEGDVAKVAVENIGKLSALVPLGGRHIYSRLELTQLLCRAAGYAGKIPAVPEWLLKVALPPLKVINPNLYDKLAFLVQVSTQDCIAPQIGTTSLESYLPLSDEPAVAG